jgi:ribulose-phosphate 3-epimerase
MVEIIPAINAESFEEVKRRVKLVEPYVKWVHIDVADGTFTPNSLWHDPRDLLALETQLFAEVHLMVADMDIRFRDWLLPNIQRVIFHLEASHDPIFVIESIREAKKKVGLAINPHTAWQMVEPFAQEVDLIQTLAVHPGISGQKFHPEILDKIRHLRERHQGAIIEVDGGVNLKTARQCVEAGANVIAAASFIFSAKKPKEAIEKLKRLKNDSSPRRKNKIS